MFNSGKSEKQNFPLLGIFKKETNNCFQLLRGRQRSGLDECLSKVQFSSVVLQKIRTKSVPSSRVGKSHELSDFIFTSKFCPAKYNPL